jgi:hypothetical protein
MDGYIVKKKSTILKKTYLPGETVQKDAVPSDLVGVLIEKGYIMEIGANSTGTGEQTNVDNKTPIKVPVYTQDGVLELEMTPEDIVQAIGIVQLNANDAITAIKEMDDKDEALILIDALDNRKTVKNAIRAKVGAATEEDTGDGKAEGEGAGDV